MTDNNRAVHKQTSREDKLIAAALAGLTILLLLLSAPNIGVVWDEPIYFVAAEIYPGWFGELARRPAQALSAEGVAAYWTYNNEHPPFSKVWSGFIWLAARHLFSDLVAHRLGNILLSGALTALLYLFLAREYGRTAGLAGAAALLTMPRFFFHMHLASLDVPMTLMIFAVVYVFWIGRNRPGWRWTLLLGLVWGVAQTTKINGLLIPPVVLLAWTILFKPQRYLFIRLALMSAIGVVVFFISWPWLYHDSFNRLEHYWGFFTTTRLPVEQFYFGELYTPAPWHFPLVTGALVVPISLLILAAVGAFYSLRTEKKRPLGALFLMAALVSPLVLTTGYSLVYDNERLMMPLFPFLAALAGIGFARLLPQARQFAANRGLSLRQGMVTAVCAIAVFAPHTILAYDLYPYLLSYYSEAIGGAYGAKVLQLETTYWCNSYPELVEYLNENAEPGAVVWGTCHDALTYYQRQGQFRSDLQIANGADATTAYPGFALNRADFDEADYIIIQYRQSGFYRALREWMYPREPVHELMYRRLRLAEIYEQGRFR